jgi:uncharacterized membrane protein
MPPVEATYIALGGNLIELLAATVVTFHAAWAVARILTGHGSDDARLLIARGVLAALSFSVAGTLLKTIALQTWPQIRMFAFVLVLRTLLKRVFQWEQTKIEGRSGPQRRTSRHAAGAIASILFAALVLSPSAHAATGVHLPQSTLYPRLIRLGHAPHALQGSLLAKTGNRLFRSLDEGRTFTFLTTVPTVSLEAGNPVPDKDAKDKERCCSTIYELPRKFGHFKPGTLLYSGSFFSDGVPAVEIFTSTDQGAHWQYLSTPMKSGDDHHGLWEPAFSVTKDGSLAMWVSDETDPCCSQKLVQMRTRDLLTWSPKQDTVVGPMHGPTPAIAPEASTAIPGSSPGSAANPAPAPAAPSPATAITPALTSPAASPTPAAATHRNPDRPGMAIVSELPNGTWFMSYEVCGPTTHCQVYTRTSRDGWNFGDPASFGTRAVTTAGQYLAHAPTNIYDPDTKQLILSGQVLYEHDGAVSPRNGQLLFTNANLDGSGPWRTIAAPVEIPTAYDNYCPNYSSALMPTATGLLELASDYDAAHHCTSFFATLPNR